MPLRAIVTLCLFTLLAGCAGTAPVNKSADTYFKEGEDLYASKQYEDAIALYKKVKESYTSPELTAQAELKIADAQFDNGSFIEAASSYEDFRKFHPKHARAPYALYRLALCNFNQIEGIDTDQTPVKNAVTLFETFLKEYPNHPLDTDVRKKLELSRMKQLEYEIYVGRFYLRTEKYRAAIKRLEEALASFPQAPLHDETLFYLGKAYMLAGDKVKGREAFNRLLTEYGSSKYLDDARKFVEENY